jgi:allophanate hydrolase
MTVFTHDLEDAEIIDSIARGYDEQDLWSRNIPIPSPKIPEKYISQKKNLNFLVHMPKVI